MRRYGWLGLTPGIMSIWQKVFGMLSKLSDEDGNERTDLPDDPLWIAAKAMAEKRYADAMIALKALPDAEPGERATGAFQLQYEATRTKYGDSRKKLSGMVNTVTGEFFPWREDDWEIVSLKQLELEAAQAQSEEGMMYRQMARENREKLRDAEDRNREFFSKKRRGVTLSESCPRVSPQRPPPAPPDPWEGWLDAAD